MKKRIKARCIKNVYLNGSRLLFAVGDIVDFEVVEFSCKQPVWEDRFNDGIEETWIEPTEKHLKYITKMNCWEFCFYDKDFSNNGIAVPFLKIHLHK